MRNEAHGKYWITPDLLSLDRAVEHVSDASHGAVATFSGTVRTPSEGKNVVRIDYEAYPEMAEEQLAAIGAECFSRFGHVRLAIGHRTGTLAVGETSVIVAVGSVHRGEALDACRFAIEEIKKKLPVWKKEHFADGSEWVGWGCSHPHSPGSSAASSLPERTRKDGG